PAEWETHLATWLSWPKNLLTFPESKLATVEAVYCEMVRALSYGEKVKILIENEEMENKVSRQLEQSEAHMHNIILLKIKSADVWIRDYSPIFLLNKIGEKALVKWNFNAWGGKYDDLLYDDKAGEEVAQVSKAKTFRPNIVLEGGSIDVNGDGSVLTTEQCLLHKNRNPSLSRDQIEQYLKDYLNVDKIIWLKSGIEGDDTDGHIDDFARFVSKKDVLCAFDNASDDENTLVLKKNLELLEKTDFEITKLPMPKPLVDQAEGRRLPASYANFYIGNNVVLLPVFGDAKDKEAIAILSGFFPKREIVPIEASELVYGYGGIHCVTQQEPKGE
ncbi:MAG: agmatine deiminase family protein, partial [Candidatus Micrarchaeota archaeon]